MIRDSDDITLLDYWDILRKRRLGIALLVCCAVLATLGVSLILPAIYEARASILAPKESAGGGGQALAAALAASGAAQILGGILPPTTSNRDIFVSILRSDTMTRETVDRFNLRAYYRAKVPSGAVKALKEDTGISVSREGTIGITTQHTDPQVAAAMANFYVDYLDRLVGRLGTSDAGRQRIFIDERLEKTRADLQVAEENLRRFQETNRTVVLQEEAKVAIEAAARLKGEIAATEVQLQVLRTYATERNPDVVRLEKRLSELKIQLGRMQFGVGLDLPETGGATARTRKEIFVPAVRFPQVGLELVRLMREVKVQETVFQHLMAQREQAKIAEARDTPSVQVLDRAVVPDRKARPKVLLNVAIAGAASLLLGVIGALFLENLEGARRRRARRALPGAAWPGLPPDRAEKLSRGDRRPLTAPTPDAAPEEEDDAVDKEQLRLSWPVPDQEAAEGPRGTEGGQSDTPPRGTR